MIHRLAIAIEETSSKEKVAEHFVNCSKFYLCEIDENNIVLKTETFFNPLSGKLDKMKLASFRLLNLTYNFCEL